MLIMTNTKGNLFRYIITKITKINMRWCHARDLFGSQIPVTTEGFELRIS